MERAVLALVRLLLVLALGALALGYVCRDRVGTALFARALNQRRGLSCTTPEIAVSASLNHVRLSPLSCSVIEGPVRSFETGVTHLRLLRLRVRSAELESASVEYRMRDVSHIKASQSELRERALPAGALRQALIAAMLDASEMYSVDAPDISVKTLTATRHGHPQFVMHELKVSLAGSWNRSQAAWVECPVDAGVVLRQLDMRVVPGWGILNATLAATPGASQRGPSKPLALRLEGRRLDGLRPRVVAELQPTLDGQS
jgi:hypothetical protein